MTRSTEELSADEARRLFLWAQGLVGAPDRKGGVDALLRRIGLVQLDTISVLARSHELVPYARLGAVGRAAVEEAYWSRPARAFEYWAHAACVIPIEDWPWLAIRRAEYAEPIRKRAAKDKTYREVLRRLADGPATATELGGAKGGGFWWDWSAAKMAVEQLLYAGIVACVERRGWKRVYDLAERAIPADLLAIEPTPEECRVELVRRAARHLGVGTRHDLADYYRLKVSKLAAPLAEAGLVPVRVRGWPGDEPAWADPDALDALRSGRVKGRHRTTLLSPFDPIVWDRPRTARIFGFDYLFEAYVPPPKRVHGYFTMPVLSGGRLVARVDPGRSGRTFVAKHVVLEHPTAAEPTLAAITEAAAWVGADNVVVERVSPPELAPLLHRAL